MIVIDKLDIALLLPMMPVRLHVEKVSLNIASILAEKCCISGIEDVEAASRISDALGIKIGTRRESWVNAMGGPNTVLLLEGWYLVNIGVES